MTPRRVPTQERSRATVDAILTAAAYILIRDGYLGLNTNRVAERAGVNIASLYQFFPNKDSLVLELKRRHDEAINVAMSAAMAERSLKSREARVRAMVEAWVAGNAVEPELHRVFMQELPRLTKHQPSLASRYCRAEEAKEFFAPWAENLPEFELSIWLITTLCETVVLRAVSERRADVKSGAFVDQLVRMITSYLRAKTVG